MLERYLLERYIRNISVKEDLFSIKILLSNKAGKGDIAGDNFPKPSLSLKLL